MSPPHHPIPSHPGAIAITHRPVNRSIGLADNDDDDETNDQRSGERLVEIEGKESLMDNQAIDLHDCLRHRAQ